MMGTGGRRLGSVVGNTPISNSNIFKGWSGAGIHADLGACADTNGAFYRSVGPGFSHPGGAHFIIKDISVNV